MLLKNENNILPLDINSIKKIAVIGPNSDKKHSFGGGSAIVKAKYEITPLKGIKSKCKGKIKIITKPEKAIALFASRKSAPQRSEIAPRAKKRNQDPIAAYPTTSKSISSLINSVKK